MDRTIAIHSSFESVIVSTIGKETQMLYLHNRIVTTDGFGLRSTGTLIAVASAIGQILKIALAASGRRGKLLVTK